MVLLTALSSRPLLKTPADPRLPSGQLGDAPPGAEAESGPGNQRQPARQDLSLIQVVLAPPGEPVLPPVFQSKGESFQQQEEPASRLQGLRDRDAATRFDREVSARQAPPTATAPAETSPPPPSVFHRWIQRDPAGPTTPWPRAAGSSSEKRRDG